MSTKTGRNEPCPCGSGRKFKHCHGASPAADATDDGSHEDASRRAFAWLVNRHLKALERETADLLYEDLWPEDGPHPDDVDPQLMHGILVNMNEWMLAAGRIEIRKAWHSINALLLADGGPPLNPAQREYIRQLGSRPLGLYRVTDVTACEGVTLVDALVPGAEPVFVNEMALADSVDPGLLLGCRILKLGERHEVSGALYPFPAYGDAVAIAAVREHLAQEIIDPEDRDFEQGFVIMTEWLHQTLLPPEPTPDESLQPRQGMVDASSGEPLMFVTDHYRVVDGPAMAALFDGCPQLKADAEGGWVRLEADSEGAERASLHIHRGRVASRLEVLYRTLQLADDGRPWFEALAGATVKHLSREQTDPLEAVREGLAGEES